MSGNIPYIQQDDFASSQMQNNVITKVDSISSKEITNGTLIKGVSLTSGSENKIQHKLKRKYVGYIVTKQSANAVFWVTSSSESETYVKLNASADCTADLWVF